MGILYHECNGLFSNMNWISGLMDEQSGLPDELPKEAFGELNRLTGHNIHTLKTIYGYCQLMRAVANAGNEKEDVVMLNEAMLLASLKGRDRIDLQYSGKTLKVTRTFAKVLAFLLNKVLEVVIQSGIDGKKLNLTINDSKGDHRLHICFSSSALFWHHELWEQCEADPQRSLPSAPETWPLQMVYELLALVGGEIVSGCTGQRNFRTEDRRPRLATELIQREISPQHLAFVIPLGLGRM